MAGESARAIAKSEQIDRSTVKRILSRQEALELIASYQAELLVDLMPKAIRAFEAALGSHDERVALAAATKLMEGLAVFQKGSIQQVTDRSDQEVESRDRKHRLYAELIEMTIDKGHRYGIQLPSELNRLEAEVNSRLTSSETS